ncbi:hypothetical protein FACS189429_0510 [Bacteroidia bacterium]|nr:hypothetical protein FACS189429_0510 [Bacteroidia bacterium]GHV44403.1 hypothetical protein FACS1894180_5720 [Bacteroidia bacterium]
MKKISLLMMLAAVVFTACEKEQDMYTVLPIEQVTKPVLAAHEDIVVTLSNYKDSTVFKWTLADFGTPTGTQYSLYVKMGDYTPELITAVFSDSLTVSRLDVAKALYKMPAPADKLAILGIDLDVQFYLIASISDAYDKAQSNTIALKVNIDPQVPLYPDDVYMIGAEFGDWKWDGAGVVTMTPVHSNAGKFWAVRYFADPANGFKWSNEKNWDAAFNSIGTDAGFTTHDGNAYVNTPGFYIVFVDYTTNTITIEPAQVYGMGDCFGGWNTGQYPFVADGSKMKLTTTNAGELRMYATSSAAGADWWQMEFVIRDGNIAYRGTGDDQLPRVLVTAGKVVTLDFNAGKGTIE